MIFVTAIVFVLIFSLLILVHEAGHFWAAKRAGVKVEEFGFGLPPRAFGIKRGETIYSINWIPFGGFVKMLGEDGSSKTRSPRSVNNQPLRVQAFIVMAGVLMNLLMAFVLLTFGFLVGIEPLIVDSEDFAAAIADGTVQVEPGIVVVESNGDSFAPGDRILTLAGTEPIQSVEEWEAAKTSIIENNETILVQVDRADGTGGTEYLSPEKLDLLSFQPLYLNRFVYLEDPGSVLAPYLKNGDVIIRIDGQEILAEADISQSIAMSSEIDLSIFRPGVGDLEITDVALPANYPIVAYLRPDSPATEFGLMVGDEIVKVNNVEVHRATDVVQVTEMAEDMMSYDVLRLGELKNFQIPLGPDRRVGVSLSDPLPYYGNLSLYESYVPHSLVKVNQVRYGLLTAPVVAVQEMWRLGKLTAVMFVGVLGDFLTADELPEGVAGPVGIAKMTFVTLQDGFDAIIRFVALLSLSLGVINILPIPALDGGRLLFIAIHALTGKRPDPKTEGWIHSVGFFFLILFLIYVTFNDVVNLF
ncbi:MAG: site-2 protease family protein [Candidatus Magasanikbacteria bacterium]|nr:site-2 protease family protein [Candidatus Magasanikbacteria bacterium]